MNVAAIQNGARLHSEGRLDEATAVYSALLGGSREQAAMAHHLLGLVATDRDDMAGALGHFEDALAAGAGSAELYRQRGDLLRKLARPLEALESYDRGLALDERDADAHHGRGVVLAALGQNEAAVESYDRAIGQKPHVRNYWNNRGVALEALGRLAEAVASYGRAVGIDRDYVQAHHNLGSVLLKLNRLHDAVRSLQEALKRNPNIPESWNLVAVALVKLEFYADALDASEQALALRPAYAEAHNNRSVALRNLKRPDEALAAADDALRARAGFPEALNSRGSALAKLNRYEAAVDSYRLAMAGLPTDGSIPLNLGMALEALGDLAGAQGAFRASEALAPQLPDARFAQGLVHIRAGEMAEGFELYETRWTQKNGPRHEFPADTLWLGGLPLGDRRLLVHSEQGFGDVIQFCRFAPQAAAPNRLILQVQPALKRLMKTLPGVSEVYAVGEETPAFDLHIPIMSLPLALGVDIDGLASTLPYLDAAPDDVAAWRSRLPAGDGRRIGLAWTGNPQHDNDHNRSIALRALGPLLAEPAQFISLQTAYRESDAALLESTPAILRFESALGDFADTAALIACCDLVITVDTAVAHLAGAMGKPVWLMLPRFSDWRWMNDRDDSPWYPSARLFRQSDFGNWARVIDRVCASLRRL